MEIRKLIVFSRQGKSTYLGVCLPIEQTEHMGFKAGDYVKIRTEGHNKIILEKIEEE